MQHTALAPYGSTQALSIVAKVGKTLISSLTPYGNQQALPIVAKVGKVTLTQTPQRQVVRKAAQ
jgi:hypothetical protein